MRFFLALHATCERLRQRLCLRFLNELEIKNKLKESNAMRIVFASRVAQRTILFFLALSVSFAFESEVRNSGR